MKQITNKQIMEKLVTIQNNISNKEIIEKIDTLQNTINSNTNIINVKETVTKLFYENKKSIILGYTGLSIAYLGIGLSLLFSSLKEIAIQYGIIYGVFFGGSIILAYLAYTRRKN